jgi:hypothetical protein
MLKILRNSGNFIGLIGESFEHILGKSWGWYPTSFPEGRAWERGWMVSSFISKKECICDLSVTLRFLATGLEKTRLRVRCLH